MGTYVSQVVSLGAIRWAAERVLDMHVERVETVRATGRCGQCRPDGRCDMLYWARILVAQTDYDQLGVGSALPPIEDQWRSIPGAIALTA